MDDLTLSHYKNLSWGTTIQDQERAIVFLTEYFRSNPDECDCLITGGGKGDWENRAIVLCAQDDAVLEPLLPKMLRRLVDPNWPGGGIIIDRLIVMRGTKIDECIAEARSLAKEDKDVMWQTVLQDITDKRRELDYTGDGVVS